MKIPSTTKAWMILLPLAGIMSWILPDMQIQRGPQPEMQIQRNPSPLASPAARPVMSPAARPDAPVYGRTL